MVLAMDNMYSGLLQSDCQLLFDTSRYIIKDIDNIFWQQWLNVENVP